MFNSILEAGVDGVRWIPFEWAVFVCMLVSLVCGVAIAISYRIKNNQYSKNFMITMVLLPALVQIVVMMVNRQTPTTLGAGIALAGAFALIRFRTVPGNSRDVMCVFFTMAVGVATSVGQVWFALVLTGILCAVFIGLKFLPIDKIRNSKERELRVTVPEDLDFESELAEVLKVYTKTAQITRIKTSKMGSLYEIRYKIVLKEQNAEKKLIDDIRIKNGNLPIVLKSMTEVTNSEL